MSCTYELWDTDSRNMVAEFASRDAALLALHDAVATQGPQALATLALSTEDGDGGSEMIARGDALVALVEREGAETPSTSASAR